MSQTNIPVTSREFKLMLNVDRFQNRAAGAEAFWRLAAFIVEKKERGRADKKQPFKEERRVTSYLDTPGGLLRQHGLSLRQRREGAKFNLTLKHRGADRYLSAARDVFSSREARNEFEEDVLPPHSVKFSKSSRVKFTADPAVRTVGDVVAIFPGVGRLGIPADTPVEVVNDFEAQEVEVELGGFTFGDGGPEVEASLSFWYLLGEDGELPMVGEFSFTYGAEETAEGELEQFHPETVDGADRFFNSLQAHAGWFNFSLTTKTAFPLDSI
ncbi:MAG TPA: CYTH domain-containing protein [Pyrinomonadaceae bacterium]|jgi:hypothetical protein